MAPPGHVAAGYATAELVLRTLHFNISSSQFTKLVWWGAFFGFAPDLDFFLAFYQAGKFKIDLSKANHRKFISHAPFLWLFAGLLVYCFARSDFYRALGVILWLSSWSHFLLDAEWGIMWFWPLSKKLYPLGETFYLEKYQNAIKAEPAELKLPFWKYWWKFATDYYLSAPGAIEIIIIIISLIYVSTVSHR